MGNVHSSKILIPVAIVTLACITAVGVAYYLRKEDTALAFEDDIASIGIVPVNHDRTMSFDKLRHVALAIHRYALDCKRVDKENNRRRRLGLLKAHRYSEYVYALLEGHTIRKESEQYIKNVVFDKLAINQEIFAASLDKAQHDPKYSAMQTAMDAMDVPRGFPEEKAREMEKERVALLAKTDIAFYVPEELERECLEALGGDWRNVVKTWIVDDLLQEHFGPLESFQVEAVLRKYHL